MARGPLKKPVKSGEERKIHKNKRTERTEGLPEDIRSKETNAVRIVDMFKKGMSDEEVKQHLIFNEGMSMSLVLSYMTAARYIMRNDFSKDRDTIIGLHLRRYDKDIHNLLTIQPRTSNFNKAIEIKTDAYFQLLDVMLQKEKLLGFHSKKFNIQINNEVNVKVESKPNKFDLSNLSLDEKIELMNLIEKAKINVHEIDGIKPNPNKTKVKTEDTTYTIINDTNTNIDSIHNIGEEKKQIQELQVLPIVDARMRLQQALQQKAKEAFEKAGSKTAENEPIRPQGK